MTLLEHAKAAFVNVRSSVLDAMMYLYQVKEEDAWKEVSGSFGEYVEQELGISQSFASKLLTVNTHYLIEGELHPDELRGIDYEKLYIAAKTEGTPEEHIAKAKTLTRRELKETKNEDEGHIHSGEVIQIHKCCGLRVAWQ